MRVGVMAAAVDPILPAGEDVLGMLAALRERGHAVQVFTADGEADLAMPVMHYADAAFALDDPADVLIYRFGGADPSGFAALRRLRCRVLVRCPEVPPVGAASRYSAHLARPAYAARMALTGLPDLRVESFLADSMAGARTLRRMGVGRGRIQLAPAMHSLDELAGEADEPSLLPLLQAHGFNVLMMGVLSPEHGIDLMAESLAMAVARSGTGVHVHHVGPHDSRLQAYTDRVGELLGQYGMTSQVSFHGSVIRPVLATFYRHCDLFWAFDRPEASPRAAIAALAFGLPVLAAPTAPLRGACGDAAEYADGCEAMAAALAGLAGDEIRRREMGRRGRVRYRDRWRPAALRRLFMRGFDRALVAGSQRVAAASLALDGDWFGLPRFRDVLRDAVRGAVPGVPDMPPWGMSGRDRRLDVVDWVLREAGTSSPAVAAYLASEAFLTYARELEVPNAASHFGPWMRLVWTFHRPASTQFDLSRSEGAAAFHQWCEREGTAVYPWIARGAA